LRSPLSSNNDEFDWLSVDRELFVVHLPEIVIHDLSMIVKMSSFSHEKSFWLVLSASYDLRPRWSCHIYCKVVNLIDDATRCYSSLLTRRYYSTLLDATLRYSTLLDAETEAGLTVNIPRYVPSALCNFRLLMFRLLNCL
jgi:hypothetical protein